MSAICSVCKFKSPVGNLLPILPPPPSFKIEEFDVTAAFAARSVSSRKCVLSEEVDLPTVHNYSPLKCWEDCVNKAATRIDGCRLASVENVRKVMLS